MIELYIKAVNILPHLARILQSFFEGIGKGQHNRLEDGNSSILRTLIGHSKSWSVSYDELLTTASRKSLYCRRLHQALIILFKSSSGMGLTYIGNLFKYRHTPYGLRGDGFNMELPNFNLKFKRNSFTYLLTNLWNSFPSRVRLSNDENDCKSKLQDFLLFRTCLIVFFLCF